MPSVKRLSTFLEGGPLATFCLRDFTKFYAEVVSIQICGPCPGGIRQRQPDWGAAQVFILELTRRNLGALEGCDP